MQQLLKLQDFIVQFAVLRVEPTLELGGYQLLFEGLRVE
jgi:hypothetical protein